MAKVTQEKKLEALKGWLKENNIPFVENYKSGYGFTMDLKIPSLMIAVFVSPGERGWENERYNASVSNGKVRFCHIYKPFFIRPADTKAFTLEKIQNCCYDRMLYMQKKYMNKINNTANSK